MSKNLDLRSKTRDELEGMFLDLTEKRAELKREAIAKGNEQYSVYTRIRQLEEALEDCSGEEREALKDEHTRALQKRRALLMSADKVQQDLAYYTVLFKGISKALDLEVR